MTRRRYVSVAVGVLLAGCGSAGVVLAGSGTAQIVATAARQTGVAAGVASTTPAPDVASTTPAPDVASTTPGARALALWRAFPVDAVPRPIVPLGDGMVLNPGFRTVAEDIAFQDGHFTLRTRLPVFLILFGSVRVVSAATALDRLRASGAHQRDNFPPLVITRVRLGGAAFLTDRGRERLPAWQFFFKGVAHPASVLAVARPDVFVPARPHSFGPLGPNNSAIDSATISRSGTAVRISFVGGHAGHAPCDDSYTVAALADRRAVAFTITTHAAPVPPGEACATVGYPRSVVLHLAQPLGARVLISSADGGAVAVTPAR